MNIKKVSFFIFAFLAIGIGLYPLSYLVLDNNLNGKSQELLASVLWNVCFYLHISLGGISLLIGWSQFIEKFRKKIFGCIEYLEKYMSSQFY